MSPLIRARLTALFLAVALLLHTQPALPQQRIPDSQEPILTFVHDFLQVFYPELLTKKQTLKLCISNPADDSWRQIRGVYFTITPNVPPGLPPPGGFVGKQVLVDVPDANRILLDGNIWLPPGEHGSRIRQVDASSQAIERLETVRQLVQSHPKWSDAQAVNALKKAGARFGPDEKEAFINSLPLDKAEPFLGRLKITSVEFAHLGSDRIGSFAAAALDWNVQAESHFPDGTDTTYFFSFEPFEGKLIDLSDTWLINGISSLDRTRAWRVTQP
jgi:hypothetical protein